MSIILYTILSVIVVSLISLVGAVFLLFRKSILERITLFLVSLSAGSLFGGVFLHILPEIAEEKGFTLGMSLLVLAGILLFFVIERIIHWRHCHILTSSNHPHHLGPMNLIGDAIHNFIDGLTIAASFIASTSLGLVTTLAIVFHEIPQEIGDLGVLMHAGFGRKKALFYNFLSALAALGGAVVGLIIGSSTVGFAIWILPVAAGGFLYIAGSDLIPELHKACEGRDSISHLIAFALGIALMLLLRVFGAG